MKKFKIDFLGKSYDAVEIDGKCVSDDTFKLDTIILAESDLDDALVCCMEKSNEYTDANRVDEGIFGFAPKDLILNGSSKELEEYASNLL